MNKAEKEFDYTDSILKQDRCFYEEQIAPMIHKEFGTYEERIAVGVVGEGSDCFGYDDEISRDHDFGIGVCLWLTEEDAKLIGEQLQQRYQETLIEWYSKNPKRNEGRETLNDRLNMRRGVNTVRGFYENILGVPVDPRNPVMSSAAWFYTDDWKFATVTNGIVFRDDLGQFSSIRYEILKHYPEKIWRMRLANEIHEFSGAMQANYARCMARGDLIAANYCKTRSIDAAMNMVFLLRKSFAPYYKWKFRAFRELAGTEEIVGLIEQASVMQPNLNHWENYRYDSRKVNSKDSLLMQFEQIAKILADELYECGLTDSHEVFLEVHCNKVVSGIE